TFGAGETGQVTPPFGGLVDDFLWQVGPNGAFSWARTAGAASYEYARGVAMLPNGDGLYGMRHFGPVTFGVGGPKQPPRPAGLSLAAFAPQGALRWAKTVTGLGELHDLHADKAGRVTLGGLFAGTVVVGTNEAKSFFLDCPSPSTQCGVVVRYAE